MVLIYAKEIMREALDGFSGISFGGQKITNLRYADDTTLVSGSKKELMDLLKEVKTASEKKGLMLNKKKKNHGYWQHPQSWQGSLFTRWR